MVLGYHLINTAYGWWLPNDPRGSMSHLIASDVIAELGELHYGRKRIQPPSSQIREFYERAARTLKHELLEFSTDDRVIIAESFGATIKRCGYICYAGAIMRDHTHLCVRKHRHKAEEMVEHLQSASRAMLIQRGHRPADHPVWGGPGWKVFLDSPDDFERTVRHIELNPIKAHWPAQSNSFVTSYDGWPSHHRVN